MKSGIKANTIRFPAKLYEQLRKAAKTHRRSMNEQIVTYLEQAMEQDTVLIKKG